MERKLNNWSRENIIKSLPGKSNITSKKFLISLHGCKCFDCNTFLRDHKSIYLDHVRPISLWGDEFDVNNHQLLCYNCHSIKTKQDIIILNIFKKLSLIQGSKNNWYSYLTKEELDFYVSAFYSLLDLKNFFPD